MKIIITIASFLMFATLTFSQNLPEVGTVWTYNFIDDTESKYTDTVFSVEAVKDTTINGTRAVKIKNTPRNCHIFSEFFYLSERNDSVFINHPDNIADFLLYDFNAKKGQSWGDLSNTRVTVDSISYLKQNSDSLKVLHVTYNFNPLFAVTPYCSKIIQKIGDTYFLENLRTYADCTGEYIPNGLISYKDSTYDLDESYFNQDCEVMVGLRNKKTKNTLSVFPSITSDYLTLTQAEKLEKSTVQIHSVSGEILRTFAFTGNEIGISNLTNGVYYLNVSNSEINETLRFVVSR